MVYESKMRAANGDTFRDPVAAPKEEKKCSAGNMGHNLCTVWPKVKRLFSVVMVQPPQLQICVHFFL